MKMNPKKLARTLGVKIVNGWLNMPGPGHSKNDRSLGIFGDPSHPDGFRMHSFAGDDEKVCRGYAKKLLHEIEESGSICLTLEDDAATPKKAKALADILRICQEAQPIHGTLSAAYLASRKCQPAEGEPWSAVDPIGGTKGR
jgi:hypothetical protein